MTDDERQAKVVEATLAGELRSCQQCKRAFLLWLFRNTCPWCVLAAMDDFSRRDKDGRAGRPMNDSEKVYLEASTRQVKEQAWLRPASDPLHTVQ